MNNLEGKIALVTGASRGIGKAIASKLAEQGAYVIGTATTEQGAAIISNTFAELNVSGEGRVLDVRNIEQIEALIDALTQLKLTPSILVNNAGVTADNLLLRMEDEEWYKVIETNLTSVFRMTRACIRAMVRARWGRVISIGSVVGIRGNSGQCNYTAAKAGLVGFSKSLAQEVGSRNITVNVVAPGFIDTDMITSLPDDITKSLLSTVPLKKLGKPEDIANAVAFLASDSAQYITGETLHVNGGMYMN